MKAKGILAAAAMAATGIVGVASPAQAYVDCQDSLTSSSYSVSCRSWTYGASYNAYVWCTNGRKHEGQYYFLSGDNKWGPWSAARCPSNHTVEAYGIEKYG